MSDISNQRSLEQERAAAAWKFVSEVKNTNESKDYGPLARSAPASIQSNGLGQTLAFWRAKGFENGRAKRDSAHAVILEQTSAWLRNRLQLPENQDIVQWIALTAQTDQYRYATSEAIAFLQWLKRFAESEISDKK